jgi:hypothetical protein
MPRKGRIKICLATSVINWHPGSGSVIRFIVKRNRKRNPVLWIRIWSDRHLLGGSRSVSISTKCKAELSDFPKCVKLGAASGFGSGSA